MCGKLLRTRMLLSDRSAEGCADGWQVEELLGLEEMKASSSKLLASKEGSMTGQGDGSFGCFPLNRVAVGDCLNLIPKLPDHSIDIVVTSPPYWGQRLDRGIGVIPDPREYLQCLSEVFSAILSKLKPRGILWINIGDAYNTPVNWRLEDSKYSSLGGQSSSQLNSINSAYTKPRKKRRAFIDPEAKWLRYGNLLALPHRLIIDLCEKGYIFRGEVVWRKKNPMPEGVARRPHRGHEGIYLFAKTERHYFRKKPPVSSYWEFGTDKVDGLPHFSRFPVALPRQCIEAYGTAGKEIIVLDPFAGSGTTGIAALEAGCSFVGFEIDAAQARAANYRLAMVSTQCSAKAGGA